MPGLDPSPLRLLPRLVEKPWGGRRLADLGRAVPPGVLVGESWDVADLDVSQTELADPVSRVAAGPHTGATLGDLIELDAAALLGEARPTAGRRFPLLVKHLDARENLSVQVHPPASLADPGRGIHLKTESWLVVGAEPGARLLLGVDDGVTADDVEAAFGTPHLVTLLRSVPARVGDVHHLPAGLIHALGAGVLVAEVQTPSDTTYRLYDWTVEHGRAPRALHREAAMASVRAQWGVNTGPQAPAVGDGLVVDSGSYTMYRRRAVAGDELVIVPRSTARVIIVVSGALSVVIAGARATLSTAGVVVLPAACESAMDVEADSVWLDVDLVSG